MCKRIDASGGLLVFRGSWIASWLTLRRHSCRRLGTFAAFDFSSHLDCFIGNGYRLMIHRLGLIAMSADSIFVADLGAGRHQWNVTIQSIPKIFRVSLRHVSYVPTLWISADAIL